MSEPETEAETEPEPESETESEPESDSESETAITSRIPAVTPKPHRAGDRASAVARAGPVLEDRAPARAR